MYLQELYGIVYINLSSIFSTMAIKARVNRRGASDSGHILGSSLTTAIGARKSCNALFVVISALIYHAVTSRDMSRAQAPPALI